MQISNKIKNPTIPKALSAKQVKVSNRETTRYNVI